MAKSINRDSGRSNSKPEPPSGNKIKVRGGLIFFYVFSAILFGFGVYYFSEIRKEILLLGDVKLYWLGPAILCQLLTYLATALIYKKLFEAFRLEHVFELKELVKVSVISFFFNQTVPSAGVSGNTFLFNYLLRQGANSFNTISIILSELLIFYLAMITYIGAFLIIALFHPVPSVFKGVLLIGLIVYLIFATIVYLAGKKRSLHFLQNKVRHIRFLKKYFDKWGQQISMAKNSQHELSMTAFLKRRPAEVIIIILWQMVIVMLDSSTIWMLFKGFGISVSIFEVLLVLICTRIISILPFSPGALILYESSFVFLFSSLDYNVGVTIVVTLIYRLLSFWLPIPAGWYMYRNWLKQNHKA